MKKSEISALIFDLDGTILNTLSSLGMSMNGVLNDLGYPEHPIEQYKYFVGEGIAALVEKALPADISKDSTKLDRAVQLMYQQYSKMLFEGPELYEGMAELLTGLEERGIKKSILSNKKHCYTVDIADKFLNKWDFDYIYGAREEVPKKPDPTGAIEISEKWGIPAENILYVGDTLIDMKTGKGAGMFTVGVEWGFRPVKELKDNGADKIASRPEDILELI